MAEPTRAPRVLIVGSGFSGLGLAHRLREQGIEDLVVLERADDVGGVWESTTYPGLTCDVPSHLYSFSFAPNPGWSSTYSPQPEIRDYLRACADRFGLRPFVRTGVEVLEAAWDEGLGRWQVQTTDGAYSAQILVTAVGPLTEPRLPDVPGLADFEGTVMHSAQWDHGHDFRGERVASVGTGSSAIQYVPHLADVAERLYVFQRTPPWVIPSGRRPITDVERAVYRRVPVAQQAVRAGVYVSRELLLATGITKRPSMLRVMEAVSRRHMARVIHDPELLRQVTPDYSLGCKRILPSNRWYPALARPDVELVPHALREVRARSVVDGTAVEREVDTIVLATGYHVTDMPFAANVRGRTGASLAETWQGSPRAYLGLTVPDFPNLFVMLGPNTGQGHTSMIYMAESQIEHVTRLLRSMDDAGAATVEVTDPAFGAYNREVDERMRGTVWNTGGCRSYYVDENGRNSAQWPDWTWRFRRRAARLDPAAYRFERGPTDPRSAGDDVRAREPG